MTRNEDNDVKMLGAVNETLTKDETSWNGNVVIQEISDDITGGTHYIQEQYIIQLRGSADVTNVKNEDRDLAETSAIKIKSGVIVYCNSVKDHSNFLFINKTNSEIKAMDDNTFCAYCVNLHEAAAALGIKLVPYNITSVDIILFKTRLDLFKTKLAVTRTAIGAAKVATANIAKELARLKGRLENELDPLVETYIDTAPTFVSEYKSARKIVHYGVRHKLAEATINFAIFSIIGNIPLRLVKITILETNDKALTDDAGIAILKIAKAGTYTIIYEKFGYETLTKTGIELAVDEVLQLDIQLVEIIIETETQETINNN